MKKYFLGLVIFFLALGTNAMNLSAIAQAPALINDSINLDHLMAMDKAKFKGKTVSEFISSEEAKGYSEINYQTTEAGSLEAIRFKYTDNLYLQVNLKAILAPERSAKENAWKLEALKEEVISEIGVIFVMHDH